MDTIKEPGKPPYTSEGSHFMYEIQAGKARGYVPDKDIAFRLLRDTSAHMLYLFANNYWTSDASKCFLIKKISLPEKQQQASLATYDFTGIGDVFLGDGRGLNNVMRIIKVVTNAEYCGASEIGACFADLGDRLIELPQNVTVFDDGGGVDETEIFLPQRDANNQLVLQLDTLGQKFDSLRTLTIPKLAFRQTSLSARRIWRGNMQWTTTTR